MGATVRPRLDPTPGASCGLVVGASQCPAGAWDMLVSGNVRGSEAILHVPLDRFLDLLEVTKWAKC